MKRSVAIRVRACLIGFALAVRRSSRVARVSLGGCGCLTLLLVAHPALATSGPPSGQLLWETARGLVLTNTRGQGARPLSVPPGFNWDDSVVLSPSGSRLLIAIPNPNGMGGVSNAAGVSFFLTDVNTGRTRPFGQLSSLMGLPGPRNAYETGQAAFSPDGKTIAFVFDVYAGPGNGIRAGIVFISVPSGHVSRPIRFSAGPPEPGGFQWLPGGRFLFLTISGVETVSRTGTGVRSVTTSLAASDTYELAAVSPSGSELAIEAETGEACPLRSSFCSRAVFVTPTVGGQAKRLARSALAPDVWSPDSRYLATQIPTGTGTNTGTNVTKLITVATGHTITVKPPSNHAWVVGWRPVTGPR